MLGLPFREVWALDFEFTSNPGCRPEPICMVARELNTNRLIRQWLYQEPGSPAPFEISDDVLFVAYFATAELGCFLALGWPLPKYVLDLCIEYRLTTNRFRLPGQPPRGHKLPDALEYFNIPSIAREEKKEYQNLAIRGGPFTDEERQHLIVYCQSDVDCLPALLERLLIRIRASSPKGESQALLRGRYTRAVARMEHVGIPLDVETLARLQHHWDAMKSHLVRDIDRPFGVYEGTTLKMDRLKRYSYEHGIEWPRTTSGRLSTTAKTFEDLSLAYPQLQPLGDLHYIMSRLKLNQLAAGPDGRNRTLLGPYSSATGRNAPKAAPFIFNQAKWLRPLVKPAEGRAVAYLDWSSQEVAIAGALSGDKALLEAAKAGDPYITFAQMAGLIRDKDATKETHPRERALAKTCLLGANYGLGVKSLAHRTGITGSDAAHLLWRLGQTFPRFTRWSKDVVDMAQQRGYLKTRLGWRVHVQTDTRETSMRNFLIQATGAEMMQLACCFASERGVSVAAPVHDALLLEGPSDTIAESVEVMKEAMDDASRQVLNGFVVRIDQEVTCWPDRYPVDPSDHAMWERILGILQRVETEALTSLTA